MTSRHVIQVSKRWVVKVGSALLTDNGQGLNTQFISELAAQIAYLRERGVEIILVSSGSIAAGLSQLGVSHRPTRLNGLQAAAAVGQASLVRHYERAFQPFQINTAQVLLTHADIANRERYLNAKNTLIELLNLNVLSVINENDTVATDEICFGDNDNLAALVANMVAAELLVILTDQQGLFTADPRYNPDATLLHEVEADDDSLLALASGGGDVGRGGMVTKLGAARTANRSGAATVIAYGREPKILERLYVGEELGTLLLAKNRLASKKQWLAGQMGIAGSVTLDDGAVAILEASGKSLLAVGVIAVTGDFKRGELINCLNTDGVEIARGLTNYSADETNKIMGKASDLLADLLGYDTDDELIHRDNMVIV